MAAALALGVGELVAGFGARLRSPIEAVATEVIDRAPEPVERFGIETFGTNDKLALVIGVLALSAVFGVLLGPGRPPPSGGGRRRHGGVRPGGRARVARHPERHRDRRAAQRGRGGGGALALRLLVPSPVRDSDAGLSPSAPLTRGGVGSRRAFLGVTAAVAAGALWPAPGAGRCAVGSARPSPRLGHPPRPAAPLPPVPRTAEAGSRASPRSSPRTATSTASTPP